MLNYADYLMIISPPDAIIKEISRYKCASVNVIGHFEGMHSMAQITITHQTRCKPFLVQPAIVQMEKRICTIPPVELKINGFNFFNHGQTAKTIYAEIEINTRTENWFRLLTNQLHIKVKNFVPHITIARNIPVTSFNKLWPNFETRAFTETFTADSLTILHRETYVEYCEWKVYKELHFGKRLMAF
jgi:2'-5' RNA ligase